MLMSKNTNKKAKGENTEEFDGVIASKVRFPLYVYPETMKTVDMIYKSDNCNTKTEFIEKAVRFYCGYLMQNKPELVSYLAPQICTITDGIIKGSEQRLARAIFKLAVEVGVQTHLLAALNELDDTALFKLSSEVTDEVRRINGIINFEQAAREQRGW